MIAEQPLEVPLSAIGEFVAEPGFWQRAGREEPTPLEVRGWQHRFD